MSLNVRLMLRFLLQLFALVVCAFALTFGLMVLVANETFNQRTQDANPATVLKVLPDYTHLHEGRVPVDPAGLQGVVSGRGWLQVLDRYGRQVFWFRVPAGIPRQYAPGLLIYNKDFPEKMGY